MTRSNLILIGIFIFMFATAGVYAYIGYSGNQAFSVHYMTEQEWSDSSCGGCHMGVYQEVAFSSHVEQDLRKWSSIIEHGVDVDSIDQDRMLVTYGQLHPGGGHMADQGVEIDCMICHEQVGGYDFQARADMIASGDFAYANEAAIAEQREKLQKSPLYVTSYMLDVLTPLPVVMEVHDHIMGPSNTALCGSSCHAGDAATTAVTWSIDDHGSYDVHAGLDCQDCHEVKEHDIGGIKSLSASGSGHMENEVGVRDCDSSGCHEGISHGGMTDAHLSFLSCESCHVPALPGTDITGTPVIRQFSWETGVREDIIYESEFTPTLGWSEGVYHDRLPTSQERQNDSLLKPFNIITGVWWDSGIDEEVLADPDNSSSIGDPIDPAIVLLADADGDGAVTEAEMRSYDHNQDGVADYPNAVLREVNMYYQASHNIAGSGTGLAAPLGCGDCHGVSASETLQNVHFADDPRDCSDCHSVVPAMDWKALGYDEDPAETDPPTDFNSISIDVTKAGERPTEIEREPAFKGLISNLLGGR